MEIFRVRKNPMELQKFGAIWKLLPWGVRKNYKILVVAQFSPSKWQKMTKNGWKLKFSDGLKCNRAQKFWCHLKALQWWVIKNFKKLVVAPFLPSKWRKTMQIGQKLKFLSETNCDRVPKIWCYLKAWFMVSEKKSYISFVTSFSPQRWTKNGLHYRGPDNSKVTACWWLWTPILVQRSKLQM